MSETGVFEKFDRALNQVATVASVEARHRDLVALHAGLVLQALDAASGPTEPEDIRTTIANDLGISLQIEDVVGAVGHLLDIGDVVRSGKFAVLIAGDTKTRLTKEADDAGRLRRSATQGWLDSTDQSLRERGDSPLTGVERVQLEADLDLFLLQLVRYHGAEVASFLYPTNEEIRPFLDVTDGSLVADLPARDERVESLRREFLPAFVREATPSRAAYIADRLNRATLLQVFRVDATASALFGQVIEPKSLYLDTNFLFRALGLQGSLLRDSSREIIVLSRKLGHSLCVTPRTLRELDYVVGLQTKWLESGPDVPPELAGVAAEFVPKNDYVSAFWRDRQRNRTTFAQFRDRYANLVLQIENLNVSVAKLQPNDEPAKHDVTTEALALRAFKPSADARVIEHDAYHKALIERLRLNATGRAPYGWYEASHLFITFDNQLPPFAAAQAQAGRAHRLPFCLMGNEWLQLLYFIDPTADVPPTTFVALINSPYLESYFSARAIGRDLVRNIASTMVEIGEYRPEVARKVFVDRALMRVLRAARSADGQKATLTQFVKAAAQETDSQIREALAAKDAEIEALQHRLRLQKPRPAATPKKKEPVLRPATDVDKLRHEIKVLRTQVADTATLREQVEAVQSQLALALQRSSSSDRWLLVLPAFLVILGIRTLTTAPRDYALGWMEVIVGATPLIAAAIVRFRRGVWRTISRVADVAALLLIAWDRLPGLRSFVKDTLASFAARIGGY